MSTQADFQSCLKCGHIHVFGRCTHYAPELAAECGCNNEPGGYFITFSPLADLDIARFTILGQQQRIASLEHYNRELQAALDRALQRDKVNAALREALAQAPCTCRYLGDGDSDTCRRCEALRLCASSEAPVPEGVQLNPTCHGLSPAQIPEEQCVTGSGLGETAPTLRWRSLVSLTLPNSQCGACMVNPIPDPRGGLQLINCMLTEGHEGPHCTSVAYGAIEW